VELLKKKIQALRGSALELDLTQDPAEFQAGAKQALRGMHPSPSTSLLEQVDSTVSKKEQAQAQAQAGDQPWLAAMLRDNGAVKQSVKVAKSAKQAQAKAAAAAAAAAPQPEPTVAIVKAKTAALAEGEDSAFDAAFDKYAKQSDNTAVTTTSPSSSTDSAAKAVESEAPMQPPTLDQRIEAAKLRVLAAETAAEKAQHDALEAKDVLAALEDRASHSKQDLTVAEERLLKEATQDAEHKATIAHAMATHVAEVAKKLAAHMQSQRKLVLKARQSPGWGQTEEPPKADGRHVKAVVQPPIAAEAPPQQPQEESDDENGPVVPLFKMPPPMQAATSRPAATATQHVEVTHRVARTVSRREAAAATPIIDAEDGVAERVPRPNEGRLSAWMHRQSSEPSGATAHQPLPSQEGYHVMPAAATAEASETLSNIEGRDEQEQAPSSTDTKYAEVDSLFEVSMPADGNLASTALMLVHPTDDYDGASTDAASSKNETVFEKQEREYKEQDAGLNDLKEAADDSKDKASDAYSNATDHAKDFVGATSTPKAQNESWTKENPAQQGHRVTKGLEEDGARIPAQDDQATGGPEDHSTSWPPSTSGGSLSEVTLVEHNEYDAYSIPDDDDSGIKQQMADSRATAQNVSDHAVHLGRAQVHAFTKPQAQNESWFKQEGEQDVTRQLVRGNAIGHLMTGGVSDGSYGSHPEGGDATITEDDFKNATGTDDKDSAESDSGDSTASLMQQSNDLSGVTNGGDDDLSNTTMQDVVDEVKAQVQSVRNASAAAIHEGRQQVGAFTTPKAQNESWFHTPGGGQDVSAKIVRDDSVGHLMTSGAEGSYGPYGGQNSATMNDTATRKEFGTDSTSPGDFTSEMLVQELDAALSGASSTTSNGTLNETEADSEIYSPERMAEEQRSFEADMLNETSVMNSTQNTLHNSSAAYEHDHIIEREADMWRQSQDTSAAVWGAVAHQDDATEATLPPTPPPTLSFHSDAPNRPPREESQVAEDLLQVLSQPEDAW